MSLLRKKKRKRVCVIGLDGVPFSLVKDLTRRGVMTAFGQLLETGELHRMKASLPEISAVSWTDFMTGSNPGEHGIFGFTDLKKQSYEMRFPNFSHLKKETFWDAMGRQNKKCIIINQPSTYPARPIHGVLISGFVALELSKAVYPPHIQKPLTQMGYKIDIDTHKARGDYSFLWSELESTLLGRQRAFSHFWKEDWDYFEMVITGTDRLHHFLWSAYEDPNHPHHHKFLEYYQKIDKLLALFIESFRNLNGTEDGLYFLSDHGFTGIQQEVFLNAWLESEGYLRFESSSPNGLEEIKASSQAFAMDPNRIYINSQEKFPRGSVPIQEKNEIKSRIAAGLEKLEFSGQKIVRRVFDAEEIYTGPCRQLGPDLIVLSEYGFDMKGSVKKKEIFSRSDLEGMHTWDDAFFWSSHDVKEDLVISDLSSIFLSRLS